VYDLRGEVHYLKFNRKHHIRLCISLHEDKETITSLEHTEKLWSSLCKEFDIPSCSQVLFSLARVQTPLSTSISITWVINHHFAEKILNSLQKFIGHFQNLTAVHLEDVCIYDQNAGTVELKVNR